MTALSDPNDILFFPQSIHIADGIGCCLGLLTAVWVRIDRSVLSLDILAVRRWLTARYVKRLTTVSATTCGSNRFSKEKNGWRPARADNQQDQDELKTIAPQHGALQKKTALKPAPISYHIA
ncbi:hypothetical protein [Klebsiella michiganensis]|uniref:hypothetical protein n=1 Tax=Klebsiella michiganensis TaxID=1134687 RepID=UPI001D0E20F5|nr:hypothetical protein [Klebsiella michiganensis]